jgi:hypothetical protein
MSRGAIFAGLTFIGFLNGSSEKLGGAIDEQGLLPALLDTFDISLIIWGATAAAVVLLLRAVPAKAGRWDFVVAGLVALAFVIPVPALSWVALAGMALWLYLSSPPRSLLRRAAGIIFALTIPTLWARLLFAALSDILLRLDSQLVSLVVGTRASGNVVPFADSSGSLFIGPSCSSFSNVSLAILCAAAVVNFYGRRWSLAVMLWTGLASAVVIAINVLRIGMIGLYPNGYDLIHGPLGATIAGWFTVLAIIAVCFEGMGRHAPAPR